MRHTRIHSSIAAAILVLLTSASALALDVGAPPNPAAEPGATKSGEKPAADAAMPVPPAPAKDEKNAGALATEQPPKAEGPPPAAPGNLKVAPAEQTAGFECVRQFVGIPGIKEPARIIVSIQDVEDGLVDKMKKCNGDLAEAQKATSTRSVDVRTTQGADGWATIKVPSDRKALLRARFHSSDQRLAANPFWQSAAFGDRTEVKLDPVEKKDAEVVGKKNP